jgi:hypothetical protein
LKESNLCRPCCSCGCNYTFGWKWGWRRFSAVWCGFPIFWKKELMLFSIWQIYDNFLRPPAAVVKWERLSTVSCINMVHEFIHLLDCVMVWPGGSYKVSALFTVIFWKRTRETKHDSSTKPLVEIGHLDRSL